jgi:hypothetical protein
MRLADARTAGGAIAAGQYKVDVEFTPEARKQLLDREYADPADYLANI